MPCTAPTDLSAYLEPSALASIERAPSGAAQGVGAELAAGLHIARCDEVVPLYIGIGAVADVTAWQSDAIRTFRPGLGFEVESGLRLFDGVDIGARIAIVHGAFTPFGVGSADAFLFGGRARFDDVKLGLDGLYTTRSPGDPRAGLGAIASVGLTHRPGTITSLVALGVGALVTTIAVAYALTTRED